MGKLVKCVDANFGPAGSIRLPLVKGQIYEVADTINFFGTSHFRLKGVLGDWACNRFVDASGGYISDEPPTQRSNSYNALPAVLQPSKAGFDAAEEHCRNVLTNTLEPGHCPCRILRHMCDYHR